MILLKNDRLKVEIAEPGESYRRSRFDWTAFIVGVEFDGKYNFTAPESLVPGEGCGGIGFCNEFGIREAIGYRDISPGERFPKIGVGLLLKKSSSAYLFSEDYDLTPFDVSIEQDDESVTFISHPMECNGYAFELKKTVKLFDNNFSISYRLENKGEKEISTDEYVHNFISLNDHPIGPDYRFKADFEFSSDEIPEILAVQSPEITWNANPQRPFYLRDDKISVDSYCWTLKHQPSGQTVSESGDFRIECFAFWGREHCVSPEAFIPLNIAPGESKTWQRNYKFSCEK
jgi:hypothetical protein